MTSSPTMTTMTTLKQQTPPTPSGVTLPLQASIIINGNGFDGFNRLVASFSVLLRSFFKSTRTENATLSDEEKIMISFARQHSAMFMS